VGAGTGRLEGEGFQKGGLFQAFLFLGWMESHISGLAGFKAHRFLSRTSFFRSAASMRLPRPARGLPGTRQHLRRDVGFARLPTVRSDVENPQDRLQHPAGHGPGLV
jgi:hypothetical protein